MTGRPEPGTGLTPEEIKALAEAVGPWIGLTLFIALIVGAVVITIVVLWMTQGD